MRQRRMTGGETRRGALLVWLVAVLSAPTAANAAPGDDEAARGLLFARRGECERAVKLLERAERLRHRPSTALALADCKVQSGDLIAASAMYATIAAETPVRGWARVDYNAVKSAQQKADEVNARIPSIRLRPATAYDDLVVQIDGKPVANIDAEIRYPPKTRLKVTAQARGRLGFSDQFTLQEGERRVVVLKLPEVPPDPARIKPTSWIGARYYGVIIPKFVMNFVADGGRSLFVPGGAVTFTTKLKRAEVTFALGYLSYYMPFTPFKPTGEPDTEWEFVGTNLGAFTATTDFMWNLPLDPAEHVNFRIGGSIGLGWMAIGQMSRVQSYPANGVPGDPSTYLACKGPNNPLGTYKYCNGLDKDGTHYPGYSEPDWFHGGIRPSLFPWLVLPQVGFGFRPTPRVSIDVDTGVSISGFLTSVGVRYGL